MYYPDEVIEEIRSKTNIVDIIGERIGLKQKGREYWCNCPFHNEKTPSFHVMPDRQMYHCFGCHAGGNVYTFLMQYENYSFQEAVEYLAERAGVTLPKTGSGREDAARRDRKYKLYEVNKTAAAYYHYVLTKTKQGELGREYFQEGRKLSPETVGKFALGYTGQGNNALYHYLKGKGFDDQTMMDAGLIQFSEKYGVTDTFWNRVIIPIVDKNSKVIAFGGRVLGDALPKYINTKETDIYNKRDNLFALNLARRSRRNGFILCEGYMDVISMHQAGFDSAVASLGTALTAGHAMILKRSGKDAVLCYDSDEAGVKAAMRAIPLLTGAGISVRVLNLKPWKDPDEFLVHEGKEAFEERIREAVNAFLFESDVLAAGTDMKDPEQKTAFHREIARKLLAFPEELERNNYLEAVAERHGIPADALQELVRKLSAGLPAGEILQPRRERGSREGGQERTRNAGLTAAERLVLAWALSEPEAPEKLMTYLEPEDFSDPVCRGLAAELFPAWKSGARPAPASLLNREAEEEEKKGISEVVSAELPEEAEEEQERILAESIRRIRRESLDRMLRQGPDGKKLQEIIREKAALEKRQIRLF